MFTAGFPPDAVGVFHWMCVLSGLVRCTDARVFGRNTLPETNMEAENPLFVEDFMVFQGTIVHFCSRECDSWILTEGSYQ